ncbi:unnamed protein product [Angiostrongylus costaricensis]|uniref:receptor protein-tyrosine kinase n=1 Tax=Angiostrongylus costaricensis TaxID=334426 RepID=A0A158PEW3_ANGCS|nr:unnamed protein product [Angiostrongylus costaricensis]
MNLKVGESDTGTYVCRSIDDPTLRSEIHIFVKVYEGLVVSETEFVVPCKSSRHLSKDDVELRVNGKLWKSAAKYFDPRTGFKVNSKTAEDKIVNQLTFQCVHKGYPPDSATFLIVFKEASKNDLEFIFEEPDPWAYVGGQYTLSCILKLKGRGRIENKYQYQLQVKCPRCSYPIAVFTIKHEILNFSNRIITIDSLTLDDSGQYSCSWYFDQVLNETIHKNVDVSPKKGQIKVCRTLRWPVCGQYSVLFYSRVVILMSFRLNVFRMNDVNVQNEQISARIDVMSPNSWVVFDQQYYQIGTPLHVSCIVTAIPQSTVTFMLWIVVSLTIVDLQVVKTVKPYHTQSDPEKPRILEYGKPAEFECNIDGTPRPEFTWLKDNKVYEGGEVSPGNRRLYISRVAAEDKGEFECVATNRAGTSVYKFSVKVSNQTPKRVSSSFLFVIFMMLLGLLFCLITALVFRTNNFFRALNVLYEQLMKTSEGPPPSGLKIPLDQRIYQLPYNRQYELERDNLEIGNRLGCGQFGQVWQGWLSKPRVSDSIAEKARLPVAVKGMSECPLVGTNVQHQKMLADELKIMCAIGKHPNVLALIGAITKNMKKGELYVVVELCDNGNLKDFLLKYKNKFINELKTTQIPDDGYLRPDSAVKTLYIPDWSNEMESDRLIADNTMLATSDLISFAMQIANGMEYLSSIPCIHRDLAARNVLLTSNKICRIADFGMAKNENKNYYRLRKKNVLVPYRWMAIEAIQDGVYTLQSDVWSFGILLFEIFTLGGLPYPTIANEDLLSKLLEGHRNSKPKYAHEDIYELMMKCWDKDPKERPNFTKCIHQLKEHLRLASPQVRCALIFFLVFYTSGSLLA